MQYEAFQTESNRENTMNLPLRKRPVEFVKAAVYDPSQDLIKLLSEKPKQVEKEELRNQEEDFEMINVETSEDSPVLIPVETPADIPIEIPVEVSVEIPVEVPAESEESVEVPVEVIEISKSEDRMTDVDAETLGSPPPDIIVTPDVIVTHNAPDECVSGTTNLSKNKKPGKLRKSKKSKIHDIPDDALFFVDNEGDDKPKKVKAVYSDPSPLPIPGSHLEFEPTMSIGNVLLTTSKNSKGEIYTSLPKRTKKLSNLNSFDEDSTIYELDDDDDDLLERNLYKSYDAYIQGVMDNLQSDDDSQDDEAKLQPDDGDGIYDELDIDFEEEARYIASAQGIESDDDIVEEDYDDNDTVLSTANTVRKLKIGSDAGEKELEDTGPEYGFLPEDYETFDNTLIETIQIRYGSTANKYFLKCLLLTGTYDFQWIDQDIFEDFLLENGMPEHRLKAYLKFVEKQVTPQELDENDYDFPISDSSFDEEDDYGRGVISDDDKGLDDLIQFTQKYEGLRNVAFEPTHGLQKRGKKRKELILDNIDDEDLRKSLQAQFDIRYESKKEKKKRWDQNVAKEHAKSQDLSLKYPYTLHIKEIRDEFEAFYSDIKRNSMAFPPLDSHGIKTIQKIAYLFNMKSRKFGTGLKSHAVVIKNKRTFRSHPDYHSVNQLMRQRPVFNRIDQKRAKTTIEHEQQKSSRRGIPSKAHVQEGDIVGANAPEISGDNIGRQLLVRMGWSNGQGLGADNRGIPEPVIAKVKKTKLGIR
jgi:hypothetical protein